MKEKECRILHDIVMISATWRKVKKNSLLQNLLTFLSLHFTPPLFTFYPGGKFHPFFNLELITSHFQYYDASLLFAYVQTMSILIKLGLLFDGTTWGKARFRQPQHCIIFFFGLSSKCELENKGK